MSTTSSKSLKRLSLLQSPTSLSSPSSSSFGSPDVASNRVELPDEVVGGFAQASPISSVSSPTTNTRAGHGSKNARRQSSIFYVSQDRDHERASQDVRSPVNERRFSALQNQNPSVNAASDDKTQRWDVSLADEQHAPMTLAEKHADLLRFIAQKESKCLELRSQLSTEEAELITLKRKWERIVSRGFGSGPSASVSSLDTDPSAQGAMLTGLKEGVQGVGRLLAHLSDLGTQSTEAEPGHTSNSSISTTLTSSSSMRLSQSSISSLGIIEDEDCAERDVLSDSSDSRTKRHSLSTAVRRRPYEPSSPSTPSPPILTPQTPLSESFIHNQPSVPKLSRSHSTTQTQPKHKKRVSATTGSFPPASSIPGVNVAPLASWVGIVGKRIGQLHAPSQVKSSSNSNSSSGTQPIHKRASTLLSDASNSLFAALASPTRPSSMIYPAPPASPSLLDDDDMLGDGSDVQWASMAALSPERPKLAPVLSVPASMARTGSDSNPAGGSAKGSDADSEEWNW